MDKCEMLKNLILSTKYIETLDEIFYNIFLGCCNEFEELIQPFHSKEKSFQQELLYMDKGLKEIEDTAKVSEILIKIRTKKEYK